MDVLVHVVLRVQEIHGVAYGRQDADEILASRAPRRRCADVRHEVRVEALAADPIPRHLRETQDPEKVGMVHVHPGGDVHLPRVLRDLLGRDHGRANALADTRDVVRALAVGHVEQFDRDLRAVAEHHRGLHRGRPAVSEAPILETQPALGEPPPGLLGNAHGAGAALRVHRGVHGVAQTLIKCARAQRGGAGASATRSGRARENDDAKSRGGACATESPTDAVGVSDPNAPQNRCPTPWTGTPPCHGRNRPWEEGGGGGLVSAPGTIKQSTRQALALMKSDAHPDRFPRRTEGLLDASG